MFTPAESSIGAIFIQYATGSYMAIEGKPVGYSSTIYNTVTKPTLSGSGIIAGTLLSGLFIKNCLPAFMPIYPAASTVNNPAILGTLSNSCVSGFLVGLGSAVGHGCTSGHMVCGVSRRRKRSIVATIVFGVSAILTSTILNNGSVTDAGVANTSYDSTFALFNEHKNVLLGLLAAGFLHSYVLLPILAKNAKESGNKFFKNLTRLFTGLSTGFHFGLGLLISGMASNSKVLNFLSIFSKDKFDPSLLAIPLFAILPNVLLWSKQIPQSKEELVTKEPLLEDKYDLSFNDEISLPFLVGNALFGIGWGMSGVCPATGLFGAEFNGKNGGFWLLSFLGGYFVGKRGENCKCHCCKNKSSLPNDEPKIN